MSGARPCICPALGAEHELQNGTGGDLPLLMWISQSGAGWGEGEGAPILPELVDAAPLSVIFAGVGVEH